MVRRACFASFNESGGFARQTASNWEPIREVAYLFAGIFICIIPVMAMLQAGKRKVRFRR